MTKIRRQFGIGFFGLIGLSSLAVGYLAQQSDSISLPAYTSELDAQSFVGTRIPLPSKDVRGARILLGRGAVVSILGDCRSCAGKPPKPSRFQSNGVPHVIIYWLPSSEFKHLDASEGQPYVIADPKRNLIPFQLGILAPLSLFVDETSTIRSIQMPGEVIEDFVQRSVG
jgi:hypothetical protein